MCQLLDNYPYNTMTPEVIPQGFAVRLAYGGVNMVKFGGEGCWVGSAHLRSQLVEKVLQFFQHSNDPKAHPDAEG